MENRSGKHACNMRCLLIVTVMCWILLVFASYPGSTWAVEPAGSSASVSESAAAELGTDADQALMQTRAFLRKVKNRPEIAGPWSAFLVRAEDYLRKAETSQSSEQRLHNAYVADKLIRTALALSEQDAAKLERERLSEQKSKLTESLVAEVAELKTRLAEEKAAAELEIRDRERKIVQLDRILKQEQGLRESAESEFKKQAAELEAERVKREVLEARVRDLASELAKQRERLDATEERVTAKDKEIQALLTEAEKRVKAERSEALRRIAEIQRELGVSKERAEELDRLKLAVEAKASLDLEEAVGRIKGLEREIDSLKLSLQQERSKKEAAESKLTQLSNELTDRQSEFLNLSSRVQELTLELGKQKVRADGAEARAALQSKEFESLMRDAEERAKTEKMEVLGRLAEVEGEAKLADERAEKSKWLRLAVEEKARSDAAEAANRLAELERELELAKRRAAENQRVRLASVENLKNDTADLQKRLADCNSELKLSKERMAECERKKVEVEDRLKAAQTDLAKRDGQIRDLSKELEIAQRLKEMEKQEPKVKPPVEDSLYLKSSARLNWHEGQAHSLLVRIFQLAKKSDFDGSCEELLAGEDDSKTASGEVTEVTLLPASDRQLKLRRAPEAKYIGVVAGFHEYNSFPPKCKVIEKFPKTKATISIDVGSNSINKIQVIMESRK